MEIQARIEEYFASQPEPKRSDLRELHRMILRLAPSTKLWYLDGRDGDKTVSNPNVGYGDHTILYAGGTSREFYRVGISANTAGISVYILGHDDKSHLARTYGEKLGRAKVTGYCIRFKALRDIDIQVLEVAIREGLASSDENASR